MENDWIIIWEESHGWTDFRMEVNPDRQIARLIVVENSIGDYDPWLESEDTVDFDKALQYVWPDEEAVAAILKYSKEDHTETLKKLGYKGEIPVKKCPKCGSQVNEDYLFCHRCGADLRVLRCAACRKELPEGSLFCPWCGKTE